MDEKDIIVMSNHDKPVKIVFEDKIKSSKTEKYHKSLKEVLYDLLWDWDIRENLSKQQIHSERGKIKRGYYDQSINFFVKRGATREFIINEVEQERERIVISVQHTFNTSMLSGNYKFGVVTLGK
jgi:hypothetical protein